MIHCYSKLVELGSIILLPKDESVNITWGTWVNEIMPNTQHKDRIGRWGALNIGNNEKKILMINACRIMTHCKAMANEAKQGSSEIPG